MKANNDAFINVYQYITVMMDMVMECQRRHKTHYERRLWQQCKDDIIAVHVPTILISNQHFIKLLLIDNHNKTDMLRQALIVNETWDSRRFSNSNNNRIIYNENDTAQNQYLRTRPARNAMTNMCNCIVGPSCIYTHTATGLSTVLDVFIISLHG